MYHDCFRCQRNTRITVQSQTANWGPVATGRCDRGGLPAQACILSNASPRRVDRGQKVYHFDGHQNGNREEEPVRQRQAKPEVAEIRSAGTGSKMAAKVVNFLTVTNTAAASPRRRVSPPPRLTAAASPRRRVTRPPRPSAVVSHRGGEPRRRWETRRRSSLPFSAVCVLTQTDPDDDLAVIVQALTV